jgi:hypothetical protein
MCDNDIELMWLCAGCCRLMHAVAGVLMVKSEREKADVV